jgi:N-acetylmuramoyl-L-alanine amidase
MLMHLPTRFLALAMAMLCALPLHAAAKKHAPVETPWQLAESARETLAQEPEGTRTRNDYTLVMDAYRTIYHGDPGDLKAPDAVFAVAGLLVDEGRVLHDQKALRNAIGQYEFLRTQYPKSSLRISALYAEAQVAQNDLNDSKLAKEKYALYLDTYPHASQGEEARQALAALRSGRTPAQPSLAKQTTQTPQNEAYLPATAPTNAPLPLVQSTSADAAMPQASASPYNPAPHRNGHLASVTAIRHWSTPNYTRVVIDLGDDIQYEAARVPHPDRIYFDLHGTRLAQELIGKNFSVTDDGFLKRIRAAQFSNDMTRVVLDVNDVTEYSAFLLPNPSRLIIDIHGGAKSASAPGTAETQAPPPANPNLPVVRATPKLSPSTAPPVANVPSTIALHNTSFSSHDVASLSQQPDRQKATAAPTSQPIAQVVSAQTGTDEAAPTTTSSISRKPRRGSTKLTMPDPSADRVALPTADGQRSLVRALGLKIGRIVIDAGHGGHDVGTLGVDGIQEKDVVLDVALRLGKMLHDRLGAEIIYTRSDDTFIPLETRTAIANKAQADLFISVHANSSSDPTARGVEVYYLNFTSQPDALDVAARENAVSNQGIYQLADLVKKITLKDKIDESREFAVDVEDSLYKGLQNGNAGLKNRGVKKAPFVVLIGANMPSILAEISFVTNPRDAEQLRQPEYRQRVAESLYKGVARYASGLSGMRVAKSTSDAGAGGN